MIVSFKNKFIFVAIPKTATHSIRTALRPHLGGDDWEQCILFEKKSFPVKELAAIGHGHITCQQVRPYLLPGIWESFTKFCVVRCPYSRFLSMCRFLDREQGHMAEDPVGVMRDILKRDVHKKAMFKPQVDWIVNEAGKKCVESICRFENLQEDFDILMSQLGLPKTGLAKVNVSKARTAVTIVEDDIASRIRDIYSKDFEMFGYPDDGYKLL